MALQALLDDYLFLAPLVQARLADQVGDLPVDVVETVPQVLAADRRERVLMVMYAGDAFDPNEAARAGGGTSQMLRQRWLVLLALNNVAAKADARQSRAGPTLSQVHRALAGWTPPGVPRPFRRANAPLRPDINERKAIYPMGFEIQLNL